MELEEFKKIRNNQIILDGKLDLILDELSFVKRELNTVIQNQIQLEKYEIDLKGKVQDIENSLMELIGNQALTKGAK